MFKSLGKIFATGLLAVVPIVATIYLLIWLFASAERLFGAALAPIVPDTLRFPGMGLALGVLVIFVAGLLMHAWVFRTLFQKIERAVLAIPLVKSVYSAIRDFFGLLANEEQADALRVVAVTWPGTRMRLIGFVTRSDFAGLPAGVGGPDEVAVYFPMSYQIGGYTLFVPAEQIEPLDMPREAAMRFVLTAGVNAGEGRPKA